jgi:hypothetical protein
LRTSLYADDAAIFAAPIKEDIQNLSSILEGFGEVSRLGANLQKSYVVHIRCDDINLDEVLHGLPVVRASFTLKYLGLPLSIWHFRRDDFQNLEDKVVSKLPSYNGKIITMAIRIHSNG